MSHSIVDMNDVEKTRKLMHECGVTEKKNQIEDIYGSEVQAEESEVSKIRQERCHWWC